MILEALVSQLEQRFQHEKRARVCLWFDERASSRGILPLLEAHVASRSKSPFVLLAYDKAQRRGQIWLKHQVHQRLEAASPESARRSASSSTFRCPKSASTPPIASEERRLDLLEESAPSECSSASVASDRRCSAS